MTSFFPVYDGEPIVTLIVPTLRVFFLYVSLNVTITFLVLAFICIKNQFFGELPWFTAMAAFPWTAYGVSQAFYYKKATAENTKDGIKYETTMAELTPDDLTMMNDNAIG